MTRNFPLNKLNFFTLKQQIFGVHGRVNHPILTFIPQQAKAIALQKLSNVAKNAQIKRRLPVELNKVLVTTAINPLICRHRHEHDLVDLN